MANRVIRDLLVAHFTVRDNVRISDVQSAISHNEKLLKELESEHTDAI